MSVFVVFRTGKVAKYNDGDSITIENGAFAVRVDGKGLLARMPMDVVERIEFSPPCEIREARSHRRARYYEARPNQRARRKL